MVLHFACKVRALKFQSTEQRMLEKLRDVNLQLGKPSCTNLGEFSKNLKEFLALFYPPKVISGSVDPPQTLVASIL